MTQPLSLRRTSQLLEGPLRLSRSALVDPHITDRQIAALVPGLQPVVEARRALLEYQRELQAWAERRAESRRGVVSGQLDRATAHKQALVDEIHTRLERLGEVK